LRKHNFPFGARHLAPFAFYMSLMLLVGLSIVGFFLPKMLLCALFGTYLSASLLAAFRTWPSKSLWRVAIVFWLMHFCYAAGTSAGLFGRSSGAPQA
jgi:hypothetical protein